MRIQFELNDAIKKVLDGGYHQGTLVEIKITESIWII